MRSKMLAEGYFLRGGKRAKVTLVDFLGLDVEREMPCQVALDSGRVVAQIATVGLPFHHGIGIVDVGLVHAVEVLLHAAVGGHRRKSLRVFRMILHMSHQWSFENGKQIHMTTKYKTRVSKNRSTPHYSPIRSKELVFLCGEM